MTIWWKWTPYRSLSSEWVLWTLYTIYLPSLEALQPYYSSEPSGLRWCFDHSPHSLSSCTTASSSTSTTSSLGRSASFLWGRNGKLHRWPTLVSDEFIGDRGQSENANKTLNTQLILYVWYLHHTSIFLRPTMCSRMSLGDSRKPYHLQKWSCMWNTWFTVFVVLVWLWSQKSAYQPCVRGTFIVNSLGENILDTHTPCTPPAVSGSGGHHTGGWPSWPWWGRSPAWRCSLDSSWPCQTSVGTYRKQTSGCLM